VSLGVGTAPEPPTSPETILPAWVNSAGNDTTNPGTYAQPYASVAKAITEGHKIIFVAARTHSLSSVPRDVIIMAYPGTHSFSSAPVAVAAPLGFFGLVGNTPSRYTNNGSVELSSGSAQDIFQIADGANDVVGGRFSGVRFDRSFISRAAIYAANVSDMMIDHCSMNWSGTYTNKPVLYASVGAGRQMRDWIMDCNFVNRQSYARLTGAGSYRNWYVGSDIGGGDRSTAVAESWFQVDSECRGFTLSAGSYEYGAGADIQFCPAEGPWRFDGPVYQSRFYGIFGEAFHHNEGNCKLNLGDARSCFVSFGRGDWTGDGNVKINGSYYNAYTWAANASPLKYTRVKVTDRGPW
jgi:hypothetical protein